MSHRALSKQFAKPIEGWGEARGQAQRSEGGIHAESAGPARPYFTEAGIGKLFTDPKPEAAARYPRGYTPERMREVRNMAIDIEPQNWATGGKAKGAFTGPAGPRRAQEVIARSTTPASEIKEMRTMNPDAAPPRLQIKTGYPLFNAYGEYARQTPAGYGEVHIDPGRTQGTKREMRQSEEHQGQTLLHELGHVRSHLAGTQDRPMGMTEPEWRGHEEARADINRAERWRPDPRDVRAGRSQKATSAYTQPSTWNRIEGSQPFERRPSQGYQAYMQTRPSVITEKITSAARTQERGLHPMLHNKQFSRLEWLDK